MDHHKEEYEGKDEMAAQIRDENSISLESSSQTAAPPFAGFWMRFWAYLFDLFVIGSLVRLFILPLFRILDVSLHDSGMFAPISIAGAIIFYLYFILMTKLLGQTLGKMVFGLKVVNLAEGGLSWSTVIFREFIGKFISKTLLMAGFLLIAFLPKKQGIHDLFADTTVIHER